MDTCVFIYQLEANPGYLSLVEPALEWIEGGGAAVTSTLTLTELLVQPYRLGDRLRVNAIYALLTTIPNLTWVAPSLQIADQAARLRAEHGLRTPDSIQAATALAAKATGFISNDRAFRHVPGIDVLLLDDLR